MYASSKCSLWSLIIKNECKILIDLTDVNVSEKHVGSLLLLKSIILLKSQNGRKTSISSTFEVSFMLRKRYGFINASS